MARIALIVAMTRDRIIGRNGRLPWYIPADLKRFRALTLGKPVVMGRRTFQSIGRPLSGRHNLVVSRDRSYRPEGVRVEHGVDDALAAAAAIADADGGGEVMVIGGAEVYRCALEAASRLYLTEVGADVDGDVRFPAFDRANWHEVSRDSHPEHPPDIPPFSFVVLDGLGGSDHGGRVAAPTTEAHP